jgi:hypothetical protein
MFQADAFARRVFTGNPAAVMPLDSFLTGTVLQAIAREVCWLSVRRLAAGALVAEFVPIAVTNHGSTGVAVVAASLAHR